MKIVVVFVIMVVFIMDRVALIFNVVMTTVLNSRKTCQQESLF